MDLNQYLPPIFSNSSEVSNIIDSISTENAELKNAVIDLFSQIYIDTATWGLDYWEKYVGITVSPNKPFEQRRSVIKSKLRGQGTVTITLIKNVAESYINGAVDVTEQSSNYQITVKFIDDLGVPPNLEDLMQAIEDIKPAHLAVTYEYKYLLLNDIDQVMTLADLEMQPLTNFAPFEPVL